MALSFSELTAKHGSAAEIPNPVLYDLLCLTRQALIDRAKLGIKEVPESPVGIEVRRRCKQDLIWLAGYFLWETNPEGAGKPISENCITEENHGAFRQFFVQKNDSLSIAEQSPIKNRLLLWPRGGQKTTCDIADTVQWILNFPDIRILYLTAAEDLAVSILDETKGHFVIKTYEPSLMNLFFPEFCVGEKNLGNQFEFTCPVWGAKQVKRREQTIMASSVTSTLSGYHFEVLKSDDAVSNRNSENEEQCRKVTKNFAINKKMLRPFGYSDKIGTRYADEDMYGDDIEKNVGDLKVTRGTGWELTENPDMKSLVLIGKAITIKPDVALQLEKDGKPVTYKEAGVEGCDLLMPSVLNYPFLMSEFAKDEISFEGQMNQNPRPASTTTFDRPLLLRNTVGFQDMPHRGPVSHTWDFAFSQKKGRDYSTACSAMWNDKGQFFVHDLIRERFKPNDLAKKVVEFAMKWRPFVIGIEEAAGSRFIEPTIIAEAMKTGDAQIIAVCSKIDWFPPDNQKDAKKMRMASLHPWFVNERLKLANYLPFIDVVYSEFEKCLTSHHHDDIPDVISQQPRYAPRMQQVIQAAEISTWSQSNAAWNLLYEEGTDAFGRVGGSGFGPTPIYSDIDLGDNDLRTETYHPGFESILGGGLFG